MHLNAPDTYIQEQTGLWAPELSNSDTTAAFIGYTEKGPPHEACHASIRSGNMRNCSGGRK